jgi:hypothetical protein
MVGHTLKYVLDSNVFIEASRRYYSFDFAKPFWTSLCDYGKQGLVCSIDKVYEEIKSGDDLLKKWAVEDFHEYFMSTEEPEVLSAYATIVQWAQQQSQFLQRAKDVFMEEKNADTWVLAFAIARKVKIVTHEVFSAEVQKRIPIPNVCRAFSIDYIDTFTLLKELRFNF